MSEVRSIAQKMGVKPGMRLLFVNSDSVETGFGIGPDVEIANKKIGDFDMIHAFVTTQSQFRETFPKLIAHLKPSAVIWISWPKAGQLETDLSIQKVIAIGYTFNMVESKTIGINSVWSAIKFTFPKPGKTYNNSFGTLPENYS